MIAKANAIAHGATSLRYISEKDKAEIVKLNFLPQGLSASAMWSRMMLHQMSQTGNGHPLKKTMIRMEVSPAIEESQGWTLADWRKLAEEFIREFDNVVNPRRAKRTNKGRTNIAGSQYVVALHHDSKSGVPHLHIDANRVDMEGRVNDACELYLRAITAANRVAARRGWVQAEERRRENVKEVAGHCMETLRQMPTFDWSLYFRLLQQHGYHIRAMKGCDGLIHGYSIRKGNSIFKSSELSRKLMPSQIEQTWEKLHGKEEVEEPHCQNPSPAPPHVVSDEEQKIISVDGKDYSVSLPREAEEAIADELETSMEVPDLEAETAMLLFAGYVEAALAMVGTTFGGGGAPTSSDLKRDDDEDDRQWARRCAQMAYRMHNPPRQRSKGIRR